MRESHNSPYQPKEEVRRFTIAYRCPLSEKCCRREWNVGIFIVNQLGKHGFPCDFFNYQIKYLEKQEFDPIFAGRDWSCSNMENLRCIVSAINERI